MKKIDRIIILIFAVIFTIIIVPLVLAASAETATITTNAQTQTLSSFSMQSTNTGTLDINHAFSTNAETFPLSIGTIQGLSFTGAINIKSSSSLARIILVDDLGKEYLIYEAFPLISGKGIFTINKVCEETCILNNIIPNHLRFEIVDATITISTITYSLQNTYSSLAQADKSQSILTAQNTLKTAQDNYKITQINKAISSSSLRWTPGETPISKMTYAEKKKLFSNSYETQVTELPNLQGFEYYKGGIFDMESTASTTKSAAYGTSLPASWDWRNVHGENWMTPVKNQGGAGNCYAFAAVGEFESFINLYYNTHANIDLSEQLMVDCYTSAGSKIPELSNDLLNSLSGEGGRIVHNGIADESCDPYAQREGAIGGCNYNNICSDWQSRIWKTTNYDMYFPTARTSPGYPRKSITINSDDELKKYLITNGPLKYDIIRWGHAMVLIGYTQASDGWQTTQVCQGGDREFCTSSGCISRSSKCTPGKIICSPSLRYGALVENYVCDSAGNWQNAGYCVFEDHFGNCVNDKCVDTYTPAIGDKTCVASDTSMYTPVLKVYNPTQNDNSWIFKNSWGTGWGENGYARINTSIMADSMSIFSLVGPPIPPPSWNQGINCVDKDSDGYCNWGISETKPSTCPASCKPEKDCDDSNPLLGPFDINYNCEKNVPAPLSENIIQTITLNNGWNFISLGAIPNDPNVASVFSSITNKIILVKDGNGKVYWPAYSINQIGNMDYTTSYQVYANESTTLTITGTKIPTNQAISLRAGWNNFAYILDTPQPIENALKPIQGKFIIVKSFDNGGKVYWSAYGINQIGNMEIKKGYMIYMIEAANFSYIN